MKNKHRALQYGLVAGLLAFTVGATAETAHVYIYSDGSAFVREERVLTLSKGLVQGRLENIPSRVEPNSIVLHFPERVDLVDFSLRTPPKSASKALMLSPGDSVVVLTKAEQVLTGRLVLYNGGEIVLRHGQQLTHIPSQALVTVGNPQPARLPIQKTSLDFRARSRISGKTPVQLAYLTSGFSWEAVYAATVSADRRKLQLESTVILTNESGKDYYQANLVLVSGAIHRVKEAVRPIYSGARFFSKTAAEVAAPPSFSEGSLYEYHQYRLARKVDLPDGVEKLSIPFLPPMQLDCHEEYIYDGRVDGKRIRTTVVFRNPEAPLPAGTVRVFTPDEAGGLALIGEDQIGHTPKREKVRLFLGYAFDLVGKREQLASKRLSKNVRRETWRITLRNHKSKPLTVTVKEHAYGDWDIVKCSSSWKRVSTSLFEIPLTVPADSEATVTYTVELRQ